MLQKANDEMNPSLGCHLVVFYVGAFLQRTFRFTYEPDTFSYQLHMQSE